MAPVSVAAVLTSGQSETTERALPPLRALAAELGVELLFDADEARKHGLEASDGRPPDIAIVLGGDGTMLRALARFLETRVPVLGVNYGRVGFLTTMDAGELEAGLRRVFAGDYRTVELSTIEVEAGGATHVAVNDVVVSSSSVGRIVELGYAIGGEDLGVQRCDGLICSSPSGSTAYNLSSGGPVLVWGLDAMVLTFVAPHSLLVRPLVVPAGPELVVRNRSPRLETTVIVDGRQVAALEPGASASLRVGTRRSLLASLPETTFFRRYGDTFGRAEP